MTTQCNHEVVTHSAIYIDGCLKCMLVSFACMHAVLEWLKGVENSNLRIEELHCAETANQGDDHQKCSKSNKVLQG